MKSPQGSALLHGCKFMMLVWCNFTSRAQSCMIDMTHLIQAAKYCMFSEKENKRVPASYGLCTNQYHSQFYPIPQKSEAIGCDHPSQIHQEGPSECVSSFSQYSCCKWRQILSSQRKFIGPHEKLQRHKTSINSYCDVTDKTAS